MLEAVKNDGWFLQYAAEELKRDRAFVLQAVLLHGSALTHAAEELQVDAGLYHAALARSAHPLDTRDFFDALQFGALEGDIRRAYKEWLEQRRALFLLCLHPKSALEQAVVGVVPAEDLHRRLLALCAPDNMRLVGARSNAP